MLGKSRGDNIIAVVRLNFETVVHHFITFYNVGFFLSLETEIISIAPVFNLRPANTQMKRFTYIHEFPGQYKIFFCHPRRQQKYCLPNNVGTEFFNENKLQTAVYCFFASVRETVYCFCVLILILVGWFNSLVTKRCELHDILTYHSRLQIQF